GLPVEVLVAALPERLDVEEGGLDHVVGARCVAVAEAGAGCDLADVAHVAVELPLDPERVAVGRLGAGAGQHGEREDEGEVAHGAAAHGRSFGRGGRRTLAGASAGTLTRMVLGDAPPGAPLPPGYPSVYETDAVLADGATVQVRP